MSTDYAEKEREFLDSLKEDTGRDLADWMAVISAQKFTDKNEIIDWLRQQGFMFSKASWLERVHHNGGKPIYGNEAAPRLHAKLGPSFSAPSPLPVTALPVANESVDPATATPSASVAAAPNVPAREPVAAGPSEDPPSVAHTTPPPVDELILKAKALRPLAHHLLREISKAVPALVLEARDPLIILASRAEFGALLVAPRELRLALSLEGHPFGPTWKPAKVAGPPPRFPTTLTHMISLNDARQVNAELVEIVRIAANSKT